MQLRRHLLAGLALAALASACETTAPDLVDDDEGDGCTVPDTSCPAAMPFPGGPCEGNLSCNYADGPDIEWQFSCKDGRWDGKAECGLIGGVCPIPPPAEGCGGAFSGDLQGVTVAVGPAELGNFEAFADAAEPDIVWGGQGRAMIFYRLQLDGEGVPACVLVKSTVSAAGVMPETTTLPTALRCGETLRMYVVVPEGDCSANEPVDTMLRIEVEGIGATEAMLKVPAEAFCGVLG